LLHRASYLRSTLLPLMIDQQDLSDNAYVKIK
jgi:hypothetical protein